MTKDTIDHQVTDAGPADEALMLRLRDGDDLALNTLMQRWDKPLVGFILRYTNNHADAVDLAQETFVRIYEHRKRYRPKGKFSTWMFTIAANLSRNHARWKSRHPSVSTVSKADDGEESDWQDNIIDPDDQPDASAVRNDEARQIREAVQELPHDLRTAVLLFEFEGMAHADIADVLSCTPKAVETRLYRARQLLRQQLKNLIQGE